MAILKPDDWSSTSAYDMGDKAFLNGVIYEADIDIDENASGNDSPVGNSDWKVAAVLSIEEYYSLQEALEYTINTNDSKVLDSIPLSIQRVERKIGKLLRSPAQKINRVFELDGDSKFELPDDLLAITHCRLNEDNSYPSTLAERGSISIQRGDRTMYEEVRQLYNDNRSYASFVEYEYPVYYSDGTYLYTAPEYDSGTEIQLEYYQAIPELGSTVNLVNDDFEEINSDGDTLEEWVDDGNSANDFVVATEMVTSNLWTATQPHLLKAGALVDLYHQLNNQEDSQIWMQAYNELLTAAEIEFRKYDTSGAISIQQNTAY